MACGTRLPERKWWAEPGPLAGLGILIRRHGSAYTWRDGQLIDGNRFCLGPEWEDVENHASDVCTLILYS